MLGLLAHLDSIPRVGHLPSQRTGLTLQIGQSDRARGRKESSHCDPTTHKRTVAERLRAHLGVAGVRHLCTHIADAIPTRHESEIHYNHLPGTR